MSLTPQNAGDYGTVGAFLLGLLTAAWAFVKGIVVLTKWPYAVFLTIKAADKTYVKKVEDDGTRKYVHPEDFNELKEKMDEILIYVRKGTP